METLPDTTRPIDCYREWLNGACRPNAGVECPSVGTRPVHLSRLFKSLVGCTPVRFAGEAS